MPLAMIVSSMRCALMDMVYAMRHGDRASFDSALRQAHGLLDEMEKQDGAKEKIAANDVEARS